MPHAAHAVRMPHAACRTRRAHAIPANHAGTAYKAADPTPFKEQTKPTLDVNYRGTLALTKRLLPLLQAGDDPPSTYPWP